MISYQTAVGAIAAIIMHRFPVMTYKDALTCRLKVDEKMTAWDLRNSAEGSKKLLIYSANMHPRNILNPANCNAKSSPRDKATWIATMLPQLDKFPDTETRIQCDKHTRT